MPVLFAYAADKFGDEFFAEAWDEFFLWESVPEDVAESREFGTTFDPFVVFSFGSDPAGDDLPNGWPTEPLALHFLHREIESCPDFHRELRPNVRRFGTPAVPAAAAIGTTNS